MADPLAFVVVLISSASGGFIFCTRGECAHSVQSVLSTMSRVTRVPHVEL